MTVATRFAGLDAEWFAGALGTAVRGVAFEEMTFTGAASDMARVRLEYEDSGAAGPPSVIAKIRGTDEVRAAMDAAMGLFEREARFYETHAGRLPVRTPRCLFVGDGNDTPLLLEDLGGLRMGDQLEGLRHDDAERLIDVLADLHARYWGAPPDEPGLLVSPGEGAYAGMIAQLVMSGAGVVAERFADRVDPGVLAALAEHAPRWLAVLQACAEGPPTLAHNDCRLDNVFFTAEGAPVLIDWQIPARTRGTADVAYLLSGSVEATELPGCWEPLLRRYHDRLGVSDYSWEQCLAHYRVSVLYALSPGIALLGALGGTDSRGLGDAIVLRGLLHADEVDAFGALGE